MKVASTHELIEKLQAYEKENDCAGDRENQYVIEIANDSNRNRVFIHDDNYKETKIDISAVQDNELFPDRREKMKVALSPEL